MVSGIICRGKNKSNLLIMIHDQLNVTVLIVHCFTVYTSNKRAKQTWLNCRDRDPITPRDHITWPHDVRCAGRLFVVREGMIRYPDYRLNQSYIVFIVCTSLHKQNGISFKSSRHIEIEFKNYPPCILSRCTTWYYHTTQYTVVVGCIISTQSWTCTSVISAYIRLVVSTLLCLFSKLF